MQQRIKPLKWIAVIAVAFSLASCTTVTAESITSSASGDVITDIKARASGGGSSFNGNVNQLSDLQDLLDTAWGNGQFGLHRGHSPILKVLEAFLGINHDEMHVLMEQKSMNLAKVCEHLGLSTDNLITTLTASFEPYVKQGVTNGVISGEDATVWTGKIRDAFARRVNWAG